MQESAPGILKMYIYKNVGEKKSFRRSCAGCLRHPAQLPHLSTDRGFTGRPQPTDRGITGQPTLSTRGITVMPRGGPGRGVTGDYVIST